jgi:hypothetical protein
LLWLIADGEEFEYGAITSMTDDREAAEISLVTRDSVRTLTVGPQPCRAEIVAAVRARSAVTGSTSAPARPSRAGRASHSRP